MPLTPAEWLAAYRDAWLRRDADAAARLFTDDAVYAEQPYQEPFVGPAAVRDYWARVTATQSHIDMQYGTPLTVGNRKLIRFLNRLFFWWDARDWHDAFFKKDIANYLHEGDALFLWGEGLGCQRLAIRSIAWPPPPGTVPEPGDPGVEPPEAEASEPEPAASDLDVDPSPNR